MATIEFENPVDEKKLHESTDKFKNLTISQRTPTRVIGIPLCFIFFVNLLLEPDLVPLDILVILIHLSIFNTSRHFTFNSDP